MAERIVVNQEINDKDKTQSGQTDYPGKNMTDSALLREQLKECLKEKVEQ